MPPKRSNTLTEAELRIMRILWDRGESLVSDLVSAMPAETPLAYTSVLTTVRILEQKGYVRHTKEGQAFVYHPTVDRGQAQNKAIKHVLSRFFDNSAEMLVMNLLETEQLDSEDLRRIQSLIQQEERP